MSGAVDFLTSLSLRALSEEIHAGRVSPLEATEACLRRIEQHDPKLNCFLTLCADSALATARERTEELARGSRRGPLHGVPIALKDIFQTAGTRTTSGSAVLRDWVPDRDATVVQRLHDAGAVLLGKLNMHEHAFGVTGENPHFGPVRNPHDPERITGGSSSGSAAAVAAGMCFGSLGTDTGGSIRCPASLCGIVGLKPTYGRVSRAGVLPLAWSLDHVGPMTRTVEDAALMLEVIAGYDPDDVTTTRRPVPPYTQHCEPDVRGLRLGIPKEHFWRPNHPGMRDCVRAAIDRLAAAGAIVEEVSLPSLEHAGFAQALILCTEAASVHGATLEAQYEQFGADVRMRLLQGLCVPGADYLNARRVQNLVRREFLDRLRTFDAFLTPSVPILPSPIGATEVEVEGVTETPRFFLVRNTFPFNLTGLPALSVPCGAVEGLPVGLQITGRPWEEERLLRIARAVEII